MARHHSDGKLQNKKIKNTYPKITVDKSADFASIKIAKGVEAESFEKDGFVFCTNKDGDIIEVQILNLSNLAK